METDEEMRIRNMGQVQCHIKKKMSRVILHNLSGKINTNSYFLI